MSGELVVLVGGLRATASNRPRALHVSDASRVSCASIGFLYLLPVVKECCLSLTLSFLDSCGQGEDIVAAPVPLASCVPHGAHLTTVPRLLLDASDTENSVGFWVFAPSMSDSKRFVAIHVRLSCSVAGFPARRLASAKECYLVDPASSHMLVSKIKPCMCKYELIQTVKLRMAH